MEDQQELTEPELPVPDIFDNHANATDTYCDLNFDHTIWTSLAFTLGLILGLIGVAVTPWCSKKIQDVYYKLKDKFICIVAKVSEIVSKYRDRYNPEEEIIESTEIYKNVPIPSDLHSRDPSSWSSSNGAPGLTRTAQLMNASDGDIRALQRRLKALEEREHVNSDLLYSLQREIRHQKLMSRYPERATTATTHGNREMPMMYGLMSQLSSLEQKMTTIQNSLSNSSLQQGGEKSNRSLIKYTSVAPKDLPEKYVDLQPFYTTTRPSAFTLPYSPLSHFRRNDCNE